MARSMLNGKELTNSFWFEEINIVVFILNRSATKVVDGRTPEEETFNGQI